MPIANFRLALPWLLACGCVLSAVADSKPADTAVRFEDVPFENATFYVVHVNLRAGKIATVWKGRDDRPLLTFERAGDLCKLNGVEPLFMTNAGIFNPDSCPTGLYVENGKMLIPLNRANGDGNFFLKPNGVFFVRDDGAHIGETDAISDELVGTMHFATQSGPLLLSGGEINVQFMPDSENKKIRSGVGILGPIDVCFVLSKNEVNLHRFARFFRDRLRCSDALYLDGVISRFYLPGKAKFQSGDEQFAAMLMVTSKRVSDVTRR
jgi:uncharacterized protein YigE (DUF2233 family)